MSQFAGTAPTPWDQTRVGTVFEAETTFSGLPWQSDVALTALIGFAVYINFKMTKLR